MYVMYRMYRMYIHVIIVISLIHPHASSFIMSQRGEGKGETSQKKHPHAELYEEEQWHTVSLAKCKLSPVSCCKKSSNCCRLVGFLFSSVLIGQYIFHIFHILYILYMYQRTEHTERSWHDLWVGVHMQQYLSYAVTWLHHTDKQFYCQPDIESAWWAVSLNVLPAMWQAAAWKHATIEEAILAMISNMIQDNAGW